MVKIRTVSETKREFHVHHNRPINSIYRRFVEELMIEMHLLTVHVDFLYDPIYALGVVTSFERFMQGYRPETDKDSIFNAICQSVGADFQQYKQNATDVVTAAQSIEMSDFMSKITAVSPESAGDNYFFQTLANIKQNSNFKYSRLFAIGLYTLLSTVDPELTKEEEKRNQVLSQVAEALNLSNEKIQKDLDLYRSNLEKADQFLKVLDEAMEADRKKREKQAQTANSGSSSTEAPSEAS
ncbi:MAG: photosystem II biogenesis protein Psp29 [Snowella sp.]|nr:photosystem II biogenesis protein Psp29 [Snowella sp.]